MKVLLPSYNYAEGVSRSLKSINGNLEVLISDNSDDNQIQKISTKYNNVKYFFNKGRGPVINWNNLINNSIDETVLLLHDDEYLTSEEFKIIKKINFESNKVYLFNYKVIKDKYIINRSINNKFRGFLLNHFPKSILFINFIGPTAAYTFFNNGKNLYDEKLLWHVDLDFFYRIIKNKQIIFKDITVYSILKRNSLTNKIINKNKIYYTLKETFFLRKKYNLTYFDFIFYFMLAAIIRIINKIYSSFIKKKCDIKY